MTWKKSWIRFDGSNDEERETSCGAVDWRVEEQWLGVVGQKGKEKIFFRKEGEM